jgi:heme exporter protein CcmD
MTGVVAGGWEFVWAAYSVTAVTLLGYALSVHRRYRAERDRQRREQEHEGTRR